MNVIKAYYKPFLATISILCIFLLGVFYARDTLNEGLQGPQRMQTIAILFLSFILIAGTHALAGYWIYNRLSKRKS